MMVKVLMHKDPEGNKRGHNKLRTYRKFKNDHMQEKYLTIIKDSYIRSSVTRMRLSAHRLMIERGRHLKLSVEQRICTKCDQNLVEDEFHAIMICKKYDNERTQLFHELSTVIITWKDMDINDKFITIMKLTFETISIAQFIHHIMIYDKITNTPSNITTMVPAPR